MVDDNCRRFLAIDVAARGGDVSGWALAEMRDGRVIILDSGTGTVPSEHLSTVLIVEDVEEFRTWGPPEHERRLALNRTAEIEAIKAGDDTIQGGRNGGPPPHTLKSYNRRRSAR